MEFIEIKEYICSLLIRQVMNYSLLQNSVKDSKQLRIEVHFVFLQFELKFAKYWNME